MKKISIDKLISSLLDSLSPRQKEVLESRYGLKNKAEMTLAEIGNHYGVTRERIRQIESLALVAVRNKLNQKEFENFITLVSDNFQKMGGVRKVDLLNEDLQKMTIEDTNDKSFGNKIKFLLEVGNKFNYYHGDNNCHSFWYVNDEAKQKADAFITKLVDVLTAENDWRVEMKYPLAENYLSLSKKFATNNYGDFGLANWPHISPKTARDWAFLVLKKAKKPMHFTEMAKAINVLRKGRITNIQTVHNELIKDGRFVLVGRGIYGLKEFGLIAGTCKEVISQILKKHGPQTSKDLVKLVIAKRDFKENTLILNLQSKKHFIRQADGRYALREV